MLRRTGSLKSLHVFRRYLVEWCVLEMPELARRCSLDSADAWMDVPDVLALTRPENEPLPP